MSDMSVFMYQIRRRHITAGSNLNFENDYYNILGRMPMEFWLVYPDIEEIVRMKLCNRSGSMAGFRAKVRIR
jgi:hypothetical protein